MAGFTKLFDSILDSSVWQESKEVKLVWITMLAMADRQGVVEAAIPGLANRAGVTIKECEDAVETFLSPDPYSRTTEYEGRRIEAVDGGWRLLNHEKFREKLSKAERRAYKTEWERKKREKEKACGQLVDSSWTELDVVDTVQKQKQSTEAESLNRKSKNGEVFPVIRTEQTEKDGKDFDSLFETFKKIGFEAGIPEDFCRLTAIKAIEGGAEIVAPGAYLGTAWASREAESKKSTQDSGNSKNASESKSGAKREVWQIEKDIERFKAERLAIQKDPAKRIAATGQIETKEEHRERLESEWMEYLRSAAAEFEEKLQPDWQEYQKALEEDRKNLEATGIGSPDLVDDEGYRLERLAGMFPKDVAEFERWSKDFKKEPWIDPGALTSEAKAELQILKESLERMDKERKEAMLKENARSHRSCDDKSNPIES